MKTRLPLFLLTALYVLNFVDRQLIGILGQPIKAELGLTDAQLGLLGGLAFALFYTGLGVPVARLAERRSRVGVIAGSIAIWSAATAASGLVSRFPHVLLARLGVGLGEAGYAPAAQSLIADLHPRERRATALSLFSLGIPIGMLIGAVAGGWIAQRFGWRLAFVALGLPGIVLAILVALILREPPRGRHDAPAAEPTPSLPAVLTALIRAPGFLHMAAGASIASFAGYGLTSFAVPLLQRAFALPLGVAASGYGLVAGCAIGLGIGGGGWIADRMMSRGAAGLVSAAGAVVAALLFSIALTLREPLLFGVAAFLPLAGAHLYFGPTYGVTANSVGPAARATAIAILLFAMNAIGLGLGPLAVGALSTRIAGRIAPDLVETCRASASTARCLAVSGEGLRQALRIDVLLYLWAGAHFLLAARALRRAQPQSTAR